MDRQQQLKFHVRIKLLKNLLCVFVVCLIAFPIHAANEKGSGGGGGTAGSGGGNSGGVAMTLDGTVS